MEERYEPERFPLFSSKLQAHRADDDEPDKGEPPNIFRFAQKEDSEKNGADSPDPRKDHISGAHRNGLQGIGKKEKTGDGGRQHSRTWPEPGEPFRIFQSDRPSDLNDSCNDKKEPRHRHILLCLKNQGPYKKSIIDI
jgi:hypothetical protein